MKIVSIFLCLFSITLLSGCNYREIDRGYLVTAIGIASENASAKIYIEAISSSEVSEKPAERVVLTGEGKNFKSAFTNLKATLVKPLYFEQIGSAIVNTDLNNDIVDFLKGISNINYGIYLIKTDDINALFNADTQNGVLGYDVIGLVKTNIKVSNQLFQIKRKDFYLPTVNINNENLILTSAGENI